MRITEPLDLEGRLIIESVHASMFDGQRPTRIGKYVVLRRIGGGAMGDVYLARHEDLERNDAIKLVHPGAGHGDSDRKRLLREAQALARLTHDNVIRVHDSGVHDGRVYIAMEYVDGMTLGTWQKGKAWRDILATYVKAGRGLQAAHAVVLDDGDRSGPAPGPPSVRRGLVHRDFKPDNVLIGEDGRVRVADFGLAVPLDRADDERQRIGAPRPLDMRLTATHAVMGTPFYAAPEVLVGAPASARSDQFSFCVALYEALYSQHPYDTGEAAGPANRASTGDESPLATAADRRELPRANCRGRLRSPGRTEVPRRVFAVLARGLAHAPGERYPSMAELLAELERDTHRRTLWTSGSLTTLGLAAGLTYSQVRPIAPPDSCVDVDGEVAGLWDEPRRARVREVFASTGVPHAEASFAAVDHALGDYLAAWTRSRASACDHTYTHGALGLDLHQLNMACLDHRKALVGLIIDELSHVSADTVDSVLERVDVLPRISDCDDRLILRQTCTADIPDLESARVREALRAARAAEMSGRYPEAEPVAARAVEVARGHGIAALTAEAYDIHARILAELGRPEAAREALITAIRLAEQADCDALAAELGTRVVKLVALNPELPVEHGIAWFQYTEAKLAGLPDDDRRRADALSDRGLLRERRLKDYASAEQDYRRSLELRSRDPSATTAERALNYLNLGSVLARQHQPGPAADALEASISLYRESYGERWHGLWKPFYNLGLVATEDRRFDAAEHALTQALRFAGSAFGPEHPRVFEVHHALTALYIDKGDPERARRHIQFASEACDSHLSRTDRLCLDLRRQLAHTLELCGESAEAVELREQLLATMLLEEHAAQGEARLELAISLASLGRWEPVLEQTDAALVAFASARGDWPVADALLFRGDALLHLDCPTEAIASYRRALDAWKDDPSADSARASARWGLARALCASRGDPELARSLARDARAALAGDSTDPQTRKLVASIDAWLIRPCRPIHR
ncbi:serine/threonine-protein kinase [Nannocystis sp. SCPEA4]|uniref:serine/threonine-protein kinase n=1 Tax=Nannocystis sp. SCPEA4 TaxID=2996787 RepID=UPI00226DE9FA|nr:serine/threonine-protein kinase [Nannocystis sp. SCPEA4]MCY1059123.1 tetratricopeptide repeat protein [Nannocystis sp. SCPEA4]